MTGAEALARRATPTVISAQPATALPAGFRSALCRGALLGLSFFLLVVVAAAVVVPRATGAVTMMALTGSMAPTISAGDLIIMQKVAPEDLIVGDIVSFRPASDRPEIITDRIIEISRVGTVVSLTTQGDANVSPNAPIVADHVIGRYLYRLPGLGFVAQLAEYSSAGPAGTESDG